MIALVLTTKNKTTKHHIHSKHKRETEKTVIANKTNYTQVWYTFYDLQPGKGAGPFLQPWSLHGDPHYIVKDTIN